MTLMPIALYWVVALVGLFSQKPILVWLFFASLPFGSMVVIPTNLTGGLSLLPQTMTAMLIVAHEMLLRRSGPDAFSNLALRIPGLTLFLFWVVSILVTLFAPRWFAGQIELVPLNAPGLGFMQTTLLAPSKQNISQLAYVTVSVFSVFAFARIFQDGARLSLLTRGVMLTAIILIATGILDFMSTFLPLSPLLELFKTAEYSILDSVTIAGGSKRIIGLMPEASSYGGLTLTVMSLLWFLRRTMTDVTVKRRANVIMMGLLLMLVLSTSSASYVGIAVLLVVVSLERVIQATKRTLPNLHSGDIQREFIIALLGLAVVAIVIISAPQVFYPITERLNDVVFSKAESLSYLERSMWTRTSYEAGWESYLIGVGLGSARASNFAAALFGSTGLLGFLLYFGFVTQRLSQRIRSSNPAENAVNSALKWSFFPPFAVSLLIGTTPDFGTIEALRWGVLLALFLAVRSPGPHIRNISLERSEASFGRPKQTKRQSGSLAEVTGPRGRLTSMQSRWYFNEINPKIGLTKIHCLYRKSI